MKTLTRDEFESLVTTKTPVAELPDGSEIDLTITQALGWFDLVSTYSEPSFALNVGRWVFLGEKPDDFKHHEGLYRIEGDK